VKIFDFVTGRKAKYFVVLVWLLAVVVTGSQAGKFEDAQNNESESYLPGSAESLQEIKVEETLPGGEQLPGLIVYRRESGLTAQDRRAIEQDKQSLIDRPMKFQFGEPQTSFSRDRKMGTLAITVKSTGESNDLADVAKRLRSLSENGPDGLTAKLTGGIGYSDDAVKVFDSINGTLVFGTLAVVIILLLLIYRSPFLWILPISSIVFAELLSRAAGTTLAENGVIVNSQAASIMTVMVFGVGTDYALLLIARYREELRRHQDRHEAMAFALHRSVPAILASAATVAAALFAMVLADNNGSQSTGPIAAIGVVLAMLSALTLLPSLLLLVGRGAFWPFVPHFTGEDTIVASGFWSRLGQGIQRHPRRVWLGMLTVMAVMAIGWTSYSEGLNQTNSYREDVDSVEGAALLAKGLPPGATAPTVVLAKGDRAAGERIAGRLKRDPAVQDSRVTLVAGGYARVETILKYEPYSDAARAAVPRIRREVHQISPTALVGGATAVDFDARKASKRDNKVVIPVALFVVFLILAALLRSIALPALLMATVIASFFASLGASIWIFEHIYGFPGVDASLPLYVFIFLVALGVDYNIFLMARVREETLKVGTPEGMMRGLVATGAVITSAGLVLAGTFSILGTLPLVFITEIGFAVAFGVLFDALLVRSILVPALVWDIGPKIWWPSALSRKSG
jgi:RND superfamily putative drug exporter